MTFEQVERAIQFMLEKQATFEENDARLQASFEKSKIELDALQKKLDILTDAVGKLLAIARIHSERMDRIEGFGSS